MKHVALFVYHVEGELLLVGSDDREARLFATEHRSVDGLHVAGKSAGRVDHIVDVVALHLDVLEVVYVATGIDAHVVVDHMLL